MVVYCFWILKTVYIILIIYIYIRIALLSMLHIFSLCHIHHYSPLYASSSPWKNPRFFIIPEDFDRPPGIETAKCHVWGGKTPHCTPIFLLGADKTDEKPRKTTPIDMAVGNLIEKILELFPSRNGKVPSQPCLSTKGVTSILAETVPNPCLKLKPP